MYHTAPQNVPYCVTKCTILRHKMHHIAPQNVPYCATKCNTLRHKCTIFRHKMHHIASHNVLYPAFLVILLHHRKYRVGGGWRQQRRYANFELQKTASFVVVESLDVPPERAHSHTHTHLLPTHYLDTSERFAWITFSCLPLSTRCQNSKSGRYRLTAGSKLIG